MDKPIKGIYKFAGGGLFELMYNAKNADGADAVVYRPYGGGEDVRVGLPKDWLENGGYRFLGANWDEIDAKPSFRLVEDVVAGMQMSTDETDGYIHLPTMRVVTIEKKCVRAVEECDKNAELIERTPKWEQQSLRDALNLIWHEETYLPLPNKSDFSEQQVMEKFIDELGDESVQRPLYEALCRGADAQEFRTECFRLGLDSIWFGFRERCARAFVRGWLSAHDIDWTSELI